MISSYQEPASRDLRMTVQENEALTLDSVYGINLLGENINTKVALGGLVVSVLATGPNVRGFKLGRGRWILRAIKSVARLPSEGK
jgi:hypothetical protein